jgi:hypothetical protein
VNAQLPVRDAVDRTAEERWARAVALRLALGPVDGWPEDARFEVLERAAIAEADGLPATEAERLAEDLVRADLLRRVP